MEIREKILRTAQSLFHQHGIRNVTMDDLARHLGMSKKTVYKFFKDKDELVMEKTLLDLNERIAVMNNIVERSENAIHEIIEAMKFTSETFSEINPSVFYDMQKFHPEAWNLFRNFKENQIIQIIETNLVRGIEEGLYRQNLNKKIIAKLRSEEIELAMNPKVFPSPEYNVKEIQLQLMEHYLHGIATLKGHNMINLYLGLKED